MFIFVHSFNLFNVLFNNKKHTYGHTSTSKYFSSIPRKNISATKMINTKIKLISNLSKTTQSDLVLMCGSLFFLFFFVKENSSSQTNDSDIKKILHYRSLLFLSLSYKH